MTLDQYINNINNLYKSGKAREHSYRGDLQQLISSIVPDVLVTNEPARYEFGAPDYVITRNGIDVAYMEAKDIGDSDLSGKKKTGNKEQFDRYKKSLPNIIFTDYLDFHLYHNEDFITSVRIADVENGIIKPDPDKFDEFVNIIKDFCTQVNQTIKSPLKLAKMMAGKARLLSDVIERALTSDEEHENNSTLREQMVAFKDILIHDITAEGFADVYAQTIAYGMFAARLHDPTLETFSRQEAAELIPKSNPFLRKLFGYIAGPDIDERIKWIVDSLVEVFLATNVAEILQDYGKSTKMEDPIIHFYETFLAEYDPKLRKSRGVWYTPQPVVDFIVRAVDDILKQEFGLKDGLADTSKTKIKVKTDIKDGKFKDNIRSIEQEVHRVQILDPATGTGTFLAEVIKHIHKKFKGQAGIWSSYVENHLLPRLNGFELLMASYAMAHLKIDLLLGETGFKPKKKQRTRIYLTNSLEEHHPDTGTLFANWLSTEANEANHIKRDTPVMCVIGNPPYAVSSTNKNPWIDNLIADYKKDLNEKSYNSLSDDYVKFIRYGQHFVEKNGSGILAYISNNSFIDGIVFRQMRKHLLETFDDIYIIDLHGNSKKKEVSPDGLQDQNVFDIMQGVSINIFVKTGKKKKNVLGQIYHHDLWGKRDAKYDFLTNYSLKDINWNELVNRKPEFYFSKFDYEANIKYQKSISTDELFIVKASGVQTEFDDLSLHENIILAKTKLKDLRTLDSLDICNKYGYTNKQEKKVIQAQKDLSQNSSSIISIGYKVFTNKSSIYTGITNGIMGRPRYSTMRHMLEKNLGFVTMRSQVDSEIPNTYFLSDIPIDKNYYGFQSYLFPLYLYPDTNGQQSIDEKAKRKPNLNLEMVSQIAKGLGLEFIPDHEDLENPDHDKKFTPLDLLDYIYAVLHSPNYREKYKEFLKIDFPRVPYPKDKDKFWKLVALGGEIRGLHLLESEKVEDFITSYPHDGDNQITTKIGKKDWELFDEANGLGRIWINEDQCFDNIPLVAWEFYIGGYQPAQKWLKDRRGRTLEFDDILHYQKIIVALTETDRLMKEIDKVGVE